MDKLRAYVRKWNRKHVNSYTWRLVLEVAPGEWRFRDHIYPNKRTAEQGARNLKRRLIREEDHTS